MEKINFEAGTQVSPAKVTIDNVDHEVTPAVWEGNTPLSPFVLNKMQDNIEEETKTTQTTEVSEELTINNCAGVKGKLDIKSGKSEQATRSGKNLYNATTTMETVRGITKSGDIQSIKLNGTPTKEDRLFFNNVTLPAGTYTITMESKSGSILKTDGTDIGESDTVSFYLYIGTTTSVSWTNVATIMINVTNKKGQYTFTLSQETTLWLTYYISTNWKFTNYVINYQITKGSNADFDFEPYGVMPSPDYPSRIRNVGDNINLFDKDNANILNGYYIHATQKKLLADSNCKVLYIPCTNNETYSISKIKSERFIIGTASNIPKDTNTTFTNVLQNDSATKLTIQAGANDKYLAVWYYNKSVDTTITEQEILDSIKIEEGSIATPHTPYNCGSADFKVENKNLCYNSSFTTNNLYLYVNSKSIKQKELFLSFVTNSDLKNNSVYLKIDNVDAPDKLIGKISGTAETKVGFRHTLTDANYNAIKNGKEICFIVYKDKAGFTKIENAMIIEGLNTIDYIPHQEQIKSFPFTEGQVLHKGDYLASDGTHQGRSTYIFDGTETIFKHSNTTNNINTYYFAISDMQGGRPTDVLSSHFSFVAQCWNISNKEEGQFATNDKNIYLNSTISTIDEFKQWLAEQYEAGTPVKIDYPLAEEIVIPYTTEQEQAYYELQHLLMYEGYTSIECIDEIKPDIQLTYWYNNELNKSYGERFDKVENEICKLDNKISNLSNKKEDILYEDSTGVAVGDSIVLSKNARNYKFLLIENANHYISMIYPILNKYNSCSIGVFYVFNEGWTITVTNSNNNIIRVIGIL